MTDNFKLGLFIITAVISCLLIIPGTVYGLIHLIFGISEGWPIIVPTVMSVHIGSFCVGHIVDLHNAKKNLRSHTIECTKCGRTNDTLKTFMCSEKKPLDSVYLTPSEINKE